MADDTQPFYNPNLSYQDNYDRGPFGLFTAEPPVVDRRAVRGAAGDTAFLGASLTEFPSAYPPAPC